MSSIQAVRSLVAGRVAAAEEEIFSALERTLTATGMSPEQQRAVVHKRLLTLVEEIFQIFEMMLSECEAEVCRSHQEKKYKCEKQKCERSGSVSLSCCDPPTETDCEFIASEPSGFQTPHAEKATSTMMATETQEEHCKASGDQKLQSKQRTEVWGGRQEPFCRGSDERRIKKHQMNDAAPKETQDIRGGHCRVCGKFFSRKCSLLRHALIHEQSTGLCGVCGKRLNSDERLKGHLQSHNEENSCGEQPDDKRTEAECSKSGEEGDEKSEGSDNDDEKEEKPGSCLEKSNTKPKGSKKKDSFQLKYICKVCDKSFCYRASFFKHVHVEERDKELCGVCGKQFEDTERLRLHLQTYVRINDCEVCGKHFDGHTQLEMHMRTHTGEKPFVCSVCGKAFAQNGNLMGHMRVHTREKPYVCSVCGQGFSFKEYMRAHVRIHTGEKPFLCSMCGKGFRQRGTLKTHMMAHTGTSVHRCHICDKNFYKSGALKIHMRSHTGEKPYLCNVCGKSFSAGGSLTKHMGVHEGKRTHRCRVCGKAFLTKDDLKRHVQTHGDKPTQLTSL